MAGNVACKVLRAEASSAGNAAPAVNVSAPSDAPSMFTVMSVLTVPVAKLTEAAPSDNTPAYVSPAPESAALYCAAMLGGSVRLSAETPPALTMATLTPSCPAAHAVSTSAAFAVDRVT